jgi:hypothetical protein
MILIYATRRMANEVVRVITCVAERRSDADTSSTTNTEIK